MAVWQTLDGLPLPLAQEGGLWCPKQNCGGRVLLESGELTCMLCGAAWVPLRQHISTSEVLVHA